MVTGKDSGVPSAIPRVTAILSALALSVDHSATDPYYAARGQAVHKAVELVDKGTLDDATVEAEVAPYVSAYRGFLHQSGYRPRYWELSLVNHALNYRGTIDKFGELNGRWGILDIKTSLSVDPAAGLQLCGYEGLCQAGIEPFRSLAGFTGVSWKYVLQLKPDGKYNLITKWSKMDWRIWLGILDELRTGQADVELYCWRMKHKRIAELRHNP